MTNLDDLPIRARILMGDAPNIFRSKSLQDVNFSVSGHTRIVSCNRMNPVSYEPDKQQKQTGYGSLSLIVIATENGQQFIVHRIWLE